MSPSPLGRYGELVTAGAAVAVIASWLLAQLGVAGFAPTPALDQAGTLALGVLLGQRATTNGAAKVAQAAHRRLDAISAPPADDGAARG